MEKILRVIETESCSVCQAYYIAYNQYHNSFDRYGRHDKIEHGFTDENEVMELKSCFEKIGIKHGTTINVDVFDITEIEQYPLPNIGVIFA